MAAGVFSKLKLAGINCEYVSEYAKDKVWENSLDVLDNQVYVFAKQHHRIDRLLGKVDIILCDSPIVLSWAYSKLKSPEFKNLIYAEHHKMSSLNILIERTKTYQSMGRKESEEEAREKDSEIEQLLLEFEIPTVSVQCTEEDIERIAEKIRRNEWIEVKK
jgi:hypothetical protein